MNRLIIIATMLIVALSSLAQFEKGSISIQPKIGIGLSKLSNSSYIGNEDKVDASFSNGATFGFEAEYQIAKTFSIAAGLNYSQQGCKWNDVSQKQGNTTTKIKDSKIKLNYINLPVLLNIYVINGFSIKSGIQFGFLTNAKYMSQNEYSTRKNAGHWVVLKTLVKM